MSEERRTLAAYTGPSPAKGYVGYINFTQLGEMVRITIRPESLDGAGSVELLIPKDAAMNVCMEVAAELAWNTRKGPTS